MTIKMGLWLYDSTEGDNGYKGTDYSEYIMHGASITSPLDDTLGTAELTLTGLATGTPFTPKTKFILEATYDNYTETYHMIMDNDAVSMYSVAIDNYYNHALSLIEASADAQGRIVDNLAVTYKLSDVTLETQSTIDTATNATYSKSEKTTTYSEFEASKTGSILTNWKQVKSGGHSFEWVMPDWYSLTIDGETDTPTWDSWSEVKKNYEFDADNTPITIELPIPMLEIKSASTSGSTAMVKRGYCSLDVIITKVNMNNTADITTTTTVVHPSPNLTYGMGNYIEAWQTKPAFYDELISDALKIKDESVGWIESSLATPPTSYITYSDDTILFSKYSKVCEYSDTTFATINADRKITIDADEGYAYSVVVRRHVFDDITLTDVQDNVGQNGKYPKLTDEYSLSRNWFSTVADGIDANPPLKYSSSVSYGYQLSSLAYRYFDDQINTSTVTSSDSYLISTSFSVYAYGVKQDIYFESATIPTALQLFQRAQVATQAFDKQEGKDVYRMDLPYSIDGDFYSALEETEIIESFFNQKNLWEVLVEIGHYIHARPILKFGDDNTFECSFKQYGLTTEGTNSNNQAISVYNAQFLDEYYSALTSYVTNMVQLGGEITDVVAPKSSSDDYLVYNDVVEIHTNKPIIEILSLHVADGTASSLEWQDMTDYIYEYNIYNLLGVDSTVEPNKGLAIYYELNSTIIEGLHYQLPTVNEGDTDGEYAIKRILGRIYDMGTSDIQKIRVNNYLFKVRYRTQDTVRANHVRPDLRKYLLTSSYDNMPQHYQINNQTDTVADSVKFGTNAHGSLIRTGNQIYTITEWVNTPSKLKKEGDLYYIAGNWYYVATITNTYYPTYIVSEIEYSKDFNRLSQVIGIPSEPRFYEISEQSMIVRETCFDDALIVTTDLENITGNWRYMNSNSLDFIRDCISGTATAFPKYAVTVFKDDFDLYSLVRDKEEHYTKVLHPLNSYTLHGTLSLSWDMIDNFSAGDQVIEVADDTIDELKITDDEAYYILSPYRYCDQYGRADLVDFFILNDVTFTADEVRALPATTKDNVGDSIFTTASSITDLDSKTHGKVLAKDNREMMSFNYNLMLTTGSDRYVIGSRFWELSKGVYTTDEDGNKTGNILRVYALGQEVNKLTNGVLYLSELYSYGSTEITCTSPSDYTESGRDYVEINFSELETLLTDNGTASQVRAIAIAYQSDTTTLGNLVQLVLSRNVGDLDTDDKFESWYVGAINKDVYPKQ